MTLLDSSAVVQPHEVTRSVISRSVSPVFYTVKTCATFGRLEMRPKPWLGLGRSSRGTGTSTVNPPKVPSNPAPAARVIGQGLDVDPSWTGGDLDGNTITYDFYFETDYITSDGLVSEDQSGTTYDRGTLNLSTYYYRQIVAKDEHGATTGGLAHDFSTRTGTTCPINLTLQHPQVTGLLVTISGTVTSTCSTITRLNW